jgi:hypothetical protein
MELHSSWIALAAVLFAPPALIVGIIVAVWARVRLAAVQAQITATEAALKQQMIERGMSAEDIVRVLQTTQSRPIEAVHTDIGELMAENSYEAADILQVVQGWERLSSSVQATVRAMVEQQYEGADIVKVVEACTGKGPSLPNGEQQLPLHETTAFTR